MKFLLVGALGKMGREVCEYVKGTSDEIVAGLDVREERGAFTTYTYPADIVEKVDAIIDFSVAENRSKIFAFACSKKLPYGMFSTVISDKDRAGLEKLKKYVPVIVSSNTSLGVKILNDMTRVLASECEGADIVITENHHKGKKDSPSGTARAIENIFKDSGVEFKTVANRVGTERGFHSVQAFFDDEVVEISHRAYSRRIFAKGAICAMHRLMEAEKER